MYKLYRCGIGISCLRWCYLVCHCENQDLNHTSPTISISPISSSSVRKIHHFKSENLISEFNICYNNRSRQPDWVLEKHTYRNKASQLTNSTLDKKNIIKRNHCHFHSDDEISEPFKVYPHVYLNNIDDIDRGHLVPASNFHHSLVCYLYKFG